MKVGDVLTNFPLNGDPMNILSEFYRVRELPEGPEEGWGAEFSITVERVAPQPPDPEGDA